MSHELSANDTQAKESEHPTLVVFCKRPKLNQGKQRLVEDISAPQALNIAKALLACAIEDTIAWQGPVVIACSDEDDVQWVQSLNNNAQVMTQLPEGLTGNLGQRLNYVDHVLRALGHKTLLFIGTDAPILDSAHYQSAIDSLKTSNIALSHADDGGVVIMANNVPWPTITELPWSTDKLSLSLAQRCRESGLSVNYTKPGYDIDYVEDLTRAIDDLAMDKRPARQALTHTINQQLNLSGATNHA